MLSLLLTLAVAAADPSLAAPVDAPAATATAPARAAPAPATPATATPATATPATATPATAAPAPAPAPAAPSGDAGDGSDGAPKRLKLLVLDVKAANPDDVDAGQAETLTSFIAARAARFPIEVVSAADIRDMLELEGQKQAVGCDTAATSCLGEIAGALGADLVLSTRAGKLDAVYVVALQLFDARAATGEGRASVEAWSLGEATPKIGAAVDELLAQATGASPSEATAATPAAPKSALAIDDDLRFGLQIGGGVTAGVGLVTTVLGALPAVLYGQKRDELTVRTDRFTDEDAGRQLAQAAQIHEEALELKALYNDVGRWAVLGGVVLVVAGGGLLAAGFLLPAPTEGGAP